jgi:glycosyltransferase involved in cell wall biosynthesis
VVSLTSLGEIGPRIQALGIPVHSLNMHPGRPAALKLWKLVSILRRSQPDVVHTWMYHADLLGGLAARLAGLRAVAWGIRQGNLSPAHNKRSTLLVVRACALVSGWLPRNILSCSQRAKEVHVAAGYPEAKMVLIPNGFDLSRFAPSSESRRSVRSELGLPDDALLIGLVARDDPQKNHLGFVEAAAAVHRSVPDCHFLLAGLGIDQNNRVLGAAIQRAGLGGHMHLLGRRDDIPRLMASLDLLASPSHGEAFPNVLGEAMACAVSCVVTDAGDSAEIVGSTGRVVAVGDMAALAQQLLEVLRLPATERAALGKQARARIQAHYEIGHVAGLYQAFYERVATA